MAIFQKQQILLVWKEVLLHRKLKGLGIKEFN
jgi:hypothetical protein